MLQERHIHGVEESIEVLKDQFLCVAQSDHFQHVAMDGGSQEAHFFGEDLAKLTSCVDELRESVHLGVQF